MAIVPLSVHRDRGAPRAAQAWFVRAVPFTVSILCACGASRAPAPAAPDDAPARDVIVRTSRFSIHANAYVDFYAGARAVGALATEGRDGDPAAILDPQLVTKLGTCSDDPCAKSALLGTDEGALGNFLRATWPAHAIGARRTLGRSGTPLMELEDVIAPTLARQVGVAWPNDPIVVYVANEEGRRGPIGGRDGAVLDVEGDCFEGDALLECLFTRALDVLMPDSELGRAIEEERGRLSSAGRAASAGVVPCVATLAAATAVAATEAHYRPTRRFISVCSEPARTWLEGEWPKRMRGDESPKAFAAKLVEEAVRAGW
jgi:hypothetical protein